jgi:hypothetical protein
VTLFCLRVDGRQETDDTQESKWFAIHFPSGENNQVI